MHGLKFKSRCASLLLAFLFLACSAGNGRTGQPAITGGGKKGSPEFDADLNSVGLITTGGQKKPGYEVFKALKNHLR